VSEPTPDDRAALRELAERYAAGVDQRDAELFLSAFHADATLLVFQPSESEEPRGTRNGTEQLSDVITLISRHDRTFHFLGNSRYDVSGDEARGEVYCEAHHVSAAAGAPRTDHVMYIRYRDEYRRDAGAWSIAERRVLVDWTETREIQP
jgi:SnoaL-like protein